MNITENKMCNFMIFFISQTVSELGTSMTGVSQSLCKPSN